MTSSRVVLAALVVALAGALAFGATERQGPDAEITTATTALIGDTSGACDSNNCKPDVDDDPDSPDGNWTVATGNNVNTALRCSFGTPTGDPTVGAGLQEFRAQVRQYDGGQGGTPQARVELWESGALVRAGSDTNITSDTGQVLSFTWNANELATADGSAVEIKVVGTKSGGSPGNRNTVDVGAVEWNIDYTAGASPRRILIP